MSETQTINRDAPGIADILARREGQLPPSMLPADTATEAEPPRTETTPAQDDAAAAAAELRRQNEQLQQRSAQSESARLAAEATARRATEELHRTRQNADDANYSTVTNALEARTAEQGRLKIELKSAGEAGDFDRIADINVRLGELGAELVQLRQGKEAYEAERGNRLREPPPPAPAPTGEWTTVGQPREQFLAGRTPKTQEWLRKNDRFFTDKPFFDMVTGADAIARGRGIAADTPEYFRFIEEQAGMTQPTHNTPPPRSNGSSAPPAAPPSRDATGPTGHTTRPGDIYVTPEQKRVAEWMGVDAVEYAMQEAELKRNGELPHRRR